MVNVLIIGFGSIGVRHARILTELDCSIAVFSRRTIEAHLAFSDLATAIKVHMPEYIVIANETNRHYSTLVELTRLKYQGTLLIEKPLFDHWQPIPDHNFRQVYVAYNLRFHPIVRRMKAIADSEQVLSVQAYVGQYLPTWRSGTDYRSSYSADANRGGGVLRDLSHELDYLNWMLGGWESVTALGGHVSSLEISSDDAFSLLMKTPKCPIVSVQLNYLDRRARRSIIMNSNNHTYEADLIAGTFAIDHIIESIPLDRDVTYRSMHQAILEGHVDVACPLLDGMKTLALIDAAAQAAIKNEWVRND